MEAAAAFRIVLLGESQNGKSSLGNTIFGEAIFFVKNFNDMDSFAIEAQTKLVNGRNFTLIDTPGLFDSGRSPEAVKPELLRCIIECAPGPHVFLIVLKVEKYTEQEEDVIANIRRYFSDDALKYAAVVFTHGDQLPEGMEIKQYADQSDGLRELVEKCGGRCHVFDNRYWKNNQEDDYRSNKFQLAELLNTIDKMLMENKGGFYRNKTLNDIEREMQEEIKLLKLSTENMSEGEMRQQVKSVVLKKQLKETFWKKLVSVGAVGVGVGLLAWLIISGSNSTSSLAEESVVEAAQPILHQKAEQAIPNTFEAICDYLNALFEQTYNPFCPFD
ncbi:PREDICTED: GTPase IMAP family member 7-like [Poecilia mexicana]|uniref:GTPase IMAP family member 7-like n=1 Tax=Poecilia mexicana TaxID=48701 RepID=UPI00072E661C|nr:PREDICTED: GTPase IMAP family member 7-like [Poecilia mexicana]